MTTENELAAAWNQYNARMILATCRPKDVLCIVGHALRLLADIQAVEGKPLLPLLAAVRDAARKTLASVSKPEVAARITFSEDVAVAPSATDDPPAEEGEEEEPPIWTEEWLECCGRAGPGAPGNLAALVELLLHYTAGDGSKDDPLSLGELMQKATEADARLAAHLLSGFRGVLRKHLGASVGS